MSTVVKYIALLCLLWTVHSFPDDSLEKTEQHAESLVELDSLKEDMIVLRDRIWSVLNKTVEETESIAKFNALQGDDDTERERLRREILEKYHSEKDLVKLRSLRIFSEDVSERSHNDKLQEYLSREEALELLRLKIETASLLGELQRNTEMSENYKSMLEKGLTRGPLPNGSHQFVNEGEDGFDKASEERVVSQLDVPENAGLVSLTAETVTPIAVTAMPVAVTVMPVAMTVIPVIEELSDDAVQVCDVCSCDNRAQDSVEFLQVSCSSPLLPSADLLYWPATREVQASLMHVPWTHVDKFHVSNFMTSLLLSGPGLRHISADALAGFEALTQLSLIGSAFTSPPECSSCHNITILDLSDNQIASLKTNDLRSYPNLQTLRLKGNKLQEIPSQALRGLSFLHTVDLSHNSVFYLEFGDDDQQEDILRSLRVLDLRGNKINAVLKPVLKHATLLEYLDLSSNDLSHLSADVFLVCPTLQYLDLSDNSLSVLPDLLRVRVLRAGGNNLVALPQLPEELEELHLQHNELADIGDLREQKLDSLQTLNLSSNFLTSLSLGPLPSLLSLDLSWNSFAELPSWLGSESSSPLETLILDGNPLSSLQVPGSGLSLSKLSARSMSMLTQLEANALQGFRARNDCLHIHISHCKELKDIHEDAFKGLPLCYLDLSYNQLQWLSPSVVSWSSVSEWRGVDLQGNPWSCSCPLQWLLEEVLPRLYSHRPDLLHELRCESPRALRGVRMVHWYNREKEAFCSNQTTDPFSRFMMSTSLSSDGSVSGMSWLTISMLVAIGVLLLCVVGLGGYLLFSKTRHPPSTRTLMQRKRQQPRDANRTAQNQGLTSV